MRSAVIKVRYSRGATSKARARAAVNYYFNRPELKPHTVVSDRMMERLSRYAETETGSRDLEQVLTSLRSRAQTQETSEVASGGLGSEWTGSGAPSQPGARFPSPPHTGVTQPEPSLEGRLYDSVALAAPRTGFNREVSDMGYGEVLAQVQREESPYRYRLVLSPDPALSQSLSPEELREWTRAVMDRAVERGIKDDWIGVIHTHPSHTHVHVLAGSFGRLERGDLEAIREVGNRVQQEMHNERRWLEQEGLGVDTRKALHGGGGGAQLQDAEDDEEAPKRRRNLELGR